jgi:CO/xanthine dehydrogenase Mo-binding subunit
VDGFAVESAMDELARSLGLEPFALRERNIVRPGDPVVSWDAGLSDAEFGSYGLDQCLSLARDALARGNAAAVHRHDCSPINDRHHRLAGYRSAVDLGAAHLARD